jgi:hypothetical protein
VSRGRSGPQGHRQGCRCLFDSAWMHCRKARPRLTDLPGSMPGKCRGGSPSLWLLSLGDPRESDSGAEGARKLCFCGNFRRHKSGSAPAHKQVPDHALKIRLRESVRPCGSPVQKRTLFRRT